MNGAPCAIMKPIFPIAVDMRLIFFPAHDKDFAIQTRLLRRRGAIGDPDSMQASSLPLRR